METEVAPVFDYCRRLAFVRFPRGAKAIPAWALRGCTAMVAADLIGCKQLTVIGMNAFDACFGLRRIDLPPTVTRIGAWALSSSGLLAMNACGCSLETGEGAFAGCISLTEARFGSIRLGSFMFAGCYSLPVPAFGRIEACRSMAMFGSSVSSVEGSLPEDVMRKLFKVLVPPGSASTVAEWDGGRREGIVPMTNLIVRGGPCQIKNVHRRMLVEVDLGALDGLHPGASLEQCLFLRRVRLSPRLVMIPSRSSHSARCWRS
jgi:hypothetical protein